MRTAGNGEQCADLVQAPALPAARVLHPHFGAGQHTQHACQARAGKSPPPSRELCLKNPQYSLAGGPHAAGPNKEKLCPHEWRAPGYSQGRRGGPAGKGEQQRCGTRVTASMSTHKTYTPLLMRTQNTWGRRHKKPVALVSPGRGLGGWRGDKRLTLSYTPPHLIIYEPLK